MTLPVAILFLAMTYSTPSTPSIPERWQLPDPPSEEASQQAFEDWVTGSDSGSRRPGVMTAVTAEDLDAALSPEPRRVELFRNPLEEQARRAFLRDLPYGSALSAAAERHRVDGLLLAAVVHAESGFAPRAVSPRGAVGLMQVLPATAKAYGASDLRDPWVNADVGGRYLGTLINDYDGDLELALAAYNAGPAAVSRYGGIPPFRETREYVRKVLGRYEEYRRQVWEAAGPAGL
jgi:soluble lytic murein transglycosylase-like protein